MIRGTDGFDNCADANVAWKYAHITPPTFNGGILAGRQPYGTPGGGNSYSVYNTGFSADVKTRVYGGLHTWIVGAAIHIADYANTSDQATATARTRSHNSRSDTTITAGSASSLVDPGRASLARTAL
jgi:hypothetical protein